MYSIKEYEDKYKIYELRDETANSCVKVCPERGGIIIGFSVKDKESFYLDKETFYDDKKNIRGGNPILFPLCGQLPNETYKLNGIEYKMKNHGFARIKKWQVINKNTNNCASIKIRLQSDEETFKAYPFKFNVTFEYILKGNKLTINQKYSNESDSIMPMSVGFHPYFYAENKNLIDYKIDAKKYYDNEDSRIKDYDSQGIDLSDSKELKLILDNSGNNISFYLRDLDRKISFYYNKEFKYIVLWSTPGSNYVCVEPWTSKIGALNGGEDLLMVNPKSKLQLSWSLTVD